MDRNDEFHNGWVSGQVAWSELQKKLKKAQENLNNVQNEGDQSKIDFAKEELNKIQAEIEAIRYK